MSETKEPPPPKTLSSVVDVLLMFTSFETFDVLLSGERRVEDVTELVRQLAASALDVPHPARPDLA